MKKAYKFVLIVLMLPAWFGCKKDHDNIPADSLIGYWELAERSGSMAPATYPAGNGNFLVFKENTYAYYASGQPVKSGTYITMEDNTVDLSVCLNIADDKYTSRIVYDTAYSDPKVFYQIADDKLTFISGCYALDGGRTITYRRIKPNDTFEIPE